MLLEVLADAMLDWLYQAGEIKIHKYSYNGDLIYFPLTPTVLMRIKKEEVPQFEEFLKGGIFPVEIDDRTHVKEPHGPASMFEDAATDKEDNKLRVLDLCYQPCKKHRPHNICLGKGRIVYVGSYFSRLLQFGIYAKPGNKPVNVYYDGLLRVLIAPIAPDFETKDLIASLEQLDMHLEEE